MTINVTPIPRLTAFGAPAFTLGTTNSAGDSDIAVASNSTLLSYDAVLPVVIGQSSAAGVAVVNSRRDHVHGLVGSVPLVVAYNNATEANVTGDGTDATIRFNTELVDQGGNFASNTFTAPVTGNYQVNLMVKYGGMTSSNTVGYIYIKSTLRNFVFYIGDPWSQSNSGTLATSVAQLVPMTASNTVYATLAIYSGTQVVDVLGDGTEMLTTFSVALVG
jgi:hypothetical protein